MASSQGAAPVLHSLPDGALDHIAGLLPQQDRLNLAATCKALHSCCPRWFPVVSVRLPIDAPAVVASLAAWLRRHPARAHVVLTSSPALDTANHDPATFAFSEARLAQLAQAADAVPHIVSLGTIPAGPRLILAEPLGALTALESFGPESLQGPPPILLGSVEPLWGLTRLTRLSFGGWSASGSWSGLSRLTQLRHLGELRHCDHAAVAATLPALSRLTCLSVAYPRLSSATADWSSVSTLSGLRELHLVSRQAARVLQHLPAASLRHVNLSTGDLVALPAQLSCCTALEHLQLWHTRDSVDDAWSAPLPAASFSNLAPLTRLQYLGFENYHIIPAEVPPALTALSSLTNLTVAFASAAGGWHRLQALPLQRLAILGCRLPCLPTLPNLADLAFVGEADMPPPTDTELSDCLAPNTQLLGLTLVDCNPPAVPGCLSLLTCLTRLNLLGNPLVTGREILDSLTALQDLELDVSSDDVDSDDDDL